MPALKLTQGSFYVCGLLLQFPFFFFLLILRSPCAGCTQSLWITNEMLGGDRASQTQEGNDLKEQLVWFAWAVLLCLKGTLWFERVSEVFFASFTCPTPLTPPLVIDSAWSKRKVQYVGASEKAKETGLVSSDLLVWMTLGRDTPPPPNPTSLLILQDVIPVTFVKS